MKNFFKRYFSYTFNKFVTLVMLGWIASFIITYFTRGGLIYLTMGGVPLVILIYNMLSEWAMYKNRGYSTQKLFIDMAALLIFIILVAIVIGIHVSPTFQ